MVAIGRWVNPGLSLRSNHWAEISQRLRRICHSGLETVSTIARVAGGSRIEHWTRPLPRGGTDCLQAGAAIQNFEELTENFNKSARTEDASVAIAELFAKVQVANIAASLLLRRVWELQPPSPKPDKALKKTNLTIKNS